MHTVAPLLTALVGLAMAIAVLSRNRRDRLHQEYAYLASVVALAFLSLFFLGLAEQELLGRARKWVWHYGVMISGLLVAPASAQVYHRVLRRYNPPAGGAIPVLYAVAAVQAVVCLATPPASTAFRWVVLVTSGVIFAGLGVGVYLLHRVSRSIPDPEERARLRYLRWAGGIAVATTASEMSVHAWNSFSGTGPDLAFPPVGSIAAAAYVYFLGQVILAYRLLDLHEILADMGVFLLVATLLGGIYELLLMGVGAVGKPGTSTSIVNTFLASTVVLILYEPARLLIQRQVQNRFFQDRFEVRRAVERLRRRLPGLIEVGPLVRAVLATLEDCRRTDLASIYLWDDGRRGYVPMGWTPRVEPPLLAAVPALPFTDALREAREGCALDVARRGGDRASAADRGRFESVARTLEGMQADLALPFMVGESVLGWLCVRDSRAAKGSGYTRDEAQDLRGVVDQAGTLIDNTRQFERMKERDRLAALGEMSAGLAHEIRNPLGAIKGAAQYLQSSPFAPEDREFLGIIVEEVDRLNRVVSQFLAYARPVQVEAAPASLGDVTRSVVQLSQAQGLPEGVALDVRVDPEAPPVPVDVEKLRQVLLNLVRNALEAVHPCGTVTVSVRAAGAGGGGGEPGWLRRVSGALPESAAGAVEVVVEDDGPGIEAPDLERLFIPFFTTKDRGTGLGLALCERVVRAHAGEIEVTTRPGGGTRFIVRLPLPAQP